MAQRLAEFHRKHAPVRYVLPAPVSTVLLTREEDGSVVIGLQIGAAVCGPLKFPASEWRRVVTIVWGRGA